MKNVTAYYLFLIYATVVIKPLIPFIQDAWDHEFNEIAHVSSVHTLHGTNHLEKELATSGSENDSNNRHTLSSKDQVSYHIVTIQESRYEITENSHSKKYHLHKTGKLPLICILTQGHPPEFFAGNV